MVAPEDLHLAGKTPFPSKIRILVSAGLLLAAGCAAPPPPAAKTPAAAETPAAEETPAPEPTPVPTPAPPRDDQVVVLDPGGEEKGSTSTLVEAARAERERRAHAGPPVAVITDKTLKHYATGQLTVATPGKKAEVVPESVPEQPLRDEQYWRSHALEIRLRWRHAADDVKELEKSAAGWRRRFYAERDTYVRDGQIKPEWDRVLDRLEEGRAEVEAAKQELAEFLEEGRTAGALPGWLREGMDQEPKEEPPPSNTHEVIDPPRADQDGH